MTAVEAWQRAAASADFYGTLEELTGLNEAAVRSHWREWCALRHETAEQIAAAAGWTIGKGGFQSYLEVIRKTGRPPIAALMDGGWPDDPQPRPRRPWPASEDCPGCDKREGGPHRFGCAYRGGR